MRKSERHQLLWQHRAFILQHHAFIEISKLWALPPPVRHDINMTCEHDAWERARLTIGQTTRSLLKRHKHGVGAFDTAARCNAHTVQVRRILESPHLLHRAACTVLNWRERISRFPICIYFLFIISFFHYFTVSSLWARLICRLRRKRGPMYRRDRV